MCHNTRYFLEKWHKILNFFLLRFESGKEEKKKKKEKKKGKERKEGKRERKKEKKRKKEERESEYLYERKGPDSAYNFVLFYTFDKRYGSYENSNILLKKPKFSLNHDRKMIIFQKNCSLRSQNHKDGIVRKTTHFFF